MSNFATSNMSKAIEFFKNWTLPVAIATGAIVYCIFAFIPALDKVATVMSSFFDEVLPWSLFMILFVTFCKIDFHKMRPAWWHVCLAFAQVALLLMIVGIIGYFNLTGNSLLLMECVLTCVICPCAAASSVVTAKLGGNLESMTTFTCMSNLLAAITIPVIFPFVESGVEINFFDAFFKILIKVFVILVVPMVLAYMVKHFMKPLHRRIVSITDLGFYLWAVLLAIVTGITFKNITHAQTSAGFLLIIAAVSLAVCIAQFVLGRNMGRHFNSVIESGQGMGQKNSSFAIWVSSAYLNPLSSVAPGCYILWQNIVNSIELWQHRKHRCNHS